MPRTLEKAFNFAFPCLPQITRAIVVTMALKTEILNALLLDAWVFQSLAYSFN